MFLCKLVVPSAYLSRLTAYLYFIWAQCHSFCHINCYFNTQFFKLILNSNLNSNFKFTTKNYCTETAVCNVMFVMQQ
uniref:Secreted protein n=1 Tax=Romanomermis culicivorax TaxID=13658 RepID=A0A915L091_ROMCU